MSQIHLETYTKLETENLNTKFQPIRMKELNVIVIYTQIASGHILLAVRSCASVAIFFSKVERAPPFFFYVFNDDVMTHIWCKFRPFWSRQKCLKHNFSTWPKKVKGHFEVTSYLWLICQWLNNSEHFGAYCNLLSALEQKIWPFNWRKVRKKSWTMMTSKSDPRGHPGLKLCVHVSVMGYYRFINFHQNRRGSGIFLGDFTWNDPNIKSMFTSKYALGPRKMLPFWPVYFRYFPAAICSGNAAQFCILYLKSTATFSTKGAMCRTVTAKSVLWGEEEIWYQLFYHVDRKTSVNLCRSSIYGLN